VTVSRWAFRLYDASGDGVLQEEEVLIILQSIHNAFWRGDGLGGIDPSTREAAKIMFDAMDADKDGLVTEQEFLAACLGNTPPTKVKKRRWNTPFRKNHMTKRRFTD